MPLRGGQAGLSPFHDFPDDLLSMVFRLCRDMDPRPQIVHVCKRWLIVARNDKLLWIDIDLHKPEQALRRMMWAQGAPLEVRFAPPYAPRDDPVVFLRALRKAWQKLRTKSIRILELDRDMPTLARSIPVIAESSSTLECLSISPSQSEEDELFCEDARIPAMEIVHTVLELSDAVLAAKFPRLKRLELADCTGSWTSDLYRSPNLRILKIQMSEDVTFPAVPVGEVMATICSLVSLSELSLIGCLPPLAGLYPQGGSTVHGVANLRALETLVLRSTPDRCMFLMRHLRYPSTCRLYVACSARAQNGEAQYLIGHTVQPSMFAYRLIVDHVGIVVEVIKDEAPSTWTPCLRLVLTDGDLLPSIRSVGNALNDVQARRVSLVPRRRACFPSIVDGMFMHATATTLYLDWSGIDIRDVGESLWKTAFAFDEGAFRGLKVLVMDGLDLTPETDDEELSSVWKHGIAALKLLVEALVERHDRKVFKTLRFTYCTGFDDLKLEDIKFNVEYVE